MLDFDQLRKSNFYKTGLTRINYSNQSFLPDAGFCMYETTEQLYLEQNQQTKRFNSPIFRYMTTITLQKALSLDPFKYNKQEQEFLPQLWHKEISKQFQQVTGLLKQIKTTNLKAEIIDSFLLMVEPNSPVRMHIHQVPQTITVCYSYPETKINSDPCRFLMGHRSRQSILLPDSREFYFIMRNDPPHEVVCNQWRFFWFTDFDRYFTIPIDCDFEEWKNTLLDGSNLSSEDHEHPHWVDAYRK